MSLQAGDDADREVPLAGERADRGRACTPGSTLPRDLKVMGEVARFEYLCLAAYADKFDRVPEFNNRKTPKHSRTRRKSRSARRAT